MESNQAPGLGHLDGLPEPYGAGPGGLEGPGDRPGHRAVWPSIIPAVIQNSATVAWFHSIRRAGNGTLFCTPGYLEAECNASCRTRVLNCTGGLRVSARRSPRRQSIQPARACLAKWLAIGRSWNTTKARTAPSSCGSTSELLPVGVDHRKTGVAFLRRTTAVKSGGGILNAALSY